MTLRRKLTNAEIRNYYETAKCGNCGELVNTEYLRNDWGCAFCRPKPLPGKGKSR